MSLENLPVPPTKTPFYSPKQIFAGSFLGGPIALVYFLHGNFQKLEKRSAAMQTLWWGCFFNIALLAAMPFMPQHFPNYVIPLAYSWGARGIAESKQLSKESIAESPQFRFHSNWKVLGLGVVFLLGTALLWIAYLLAIDSLSTESP